VRDVLPEERPAGLDVRVTLAVASVAEPAGRTEPVEQRLVGLERREIEHAPVAAAVADRSVDSFRREAVIAGRRQCGYSHRGKLPPVDSL
jgi:hypothetical protein